MVCFENHAEWKMCVLFLVPRLMPVERPSSLLWRADLLSAVSSFYPCVVTSLCDAPDDCAHSAHGSRFTKTLLLSSHHISCHFMWWQSCCSDPYCLTEELWLIWPNGGGIWNHVGGMGDLESTMETRLNSSLSSSRILESWHEPQISLLSCQACPR